MALPVSVKDKPVLSVITLLVNTAVFASWLNNPVLSGRVILPSTSNSPADVAILSVDTGVRLPNDIVPLATKFGVTYCNGVQETLPTLPNVTFVTEPIR